MVKCEKSKSIQTRCYEHSPSGDLGIWHWTFTDGNIIVAYHCFLFQDVLCSLFSDSIHSLVPSFIYSCNKYLLSILYARCRPRSRDKTVNKVDKILTLWNLHSNDRWHLLFQESAKGISLLWSSLWTCMLSALPILLLKNFTEWNLALYIHIMVPQLVYKQCNNSNIC